MNSELKQQAVQSASEKLDRLIEATEKNGKLLEANRKYLRQIRRAAAWLVLLMLPVCLSSCDSMYSYVLSRYAPLDVPVVFQLRFWGMLALFGVFLASQISLEFPGRWRTEPAKPVD